MSKMKATTALAIAALGMSLTGTAQAALILAGPENFGGSGLGAVNTILTINSPNNTTTESGAVSFNGTADVITGDAMTGGSQTQTRTISSLGVTSASNLRVVFNAVEPGNASSITLTNLVLSIFSPTGTTLFSSGAFAPIAFANTFAGTGNSGFVFRLDAADTIAAQATGFGNGANRIGLLGSASNATGGFETFFAAASVTTVPVPEPGTMAIFGAALLGLWGARRKGRGKSRLA